MLLTPQQEESMIQKYYGLLFSIASRFFNRNSAAHKFDLEDYVQECIMVFLGHIRSVDSEEKVLPLPMRNMHHAMCVLVLGELPVTVPGRTADFSRMVGTFKNAGSVDEMMENGWDPGGTVSLDYSAVDERVSYEAFLSRQKPEDVRILDAMANSATMKEVAELLHMDKSTVSRKVKGLREKYLSECSLKNSLGGKNE